jgi:hypothetical protein
MKPSWLYQQDSLCVAAVLFVAMILASEAASRLGRRWHPLADDLRRGHFLAVIGSLLALFALLLSFTFSISANRYDTRRQLVIKDANVLGGLYMMSSLLPDAPRKQFKQALREFLDARAQAGALRHTPTAPEMAQFLALSDTLQQRMWDVIREAAAIQPPPRVIDSMLKGLLDEQSIQAERLVAYESRVPDPVIWLLLCGALVAIGAIGLAGGFGNHRGLPARVFFAVMICGTIDVVLDLDKPRQGFIQVSQTPILRLQQVIDRDLESKS